MAKIATEVWRDLQTSNAFKLELLNHHELDHWNPRP
ncbi:MAG: hypothetical protein RLZZ146_1196 [Bacteroidota bacterium]|jgi:hypothetical protein